MKVCKFCQNRLKLSNPERPKIRSKEIKKIWDFLYRQNLGHKFFEKWQLFFHTQSAIFFKNEGLCLQLGFEVLIKKTNDRKKQIEALSWLSDVKKQQQICKAIGQCTPVLTVSLQN